MFRVLFTFPSRYWFTIGLSGVFSLGGWSRQIHTGFHVPRATQDTTILDDPCPYGTVTHVVQLSNCFRFVTQEMSWSYNPRIAETTLVWAAPVSLATTPGITLVFSSSAYLDVSVRRVRPHCWVLGLQPSGLPHSDTHGSTLMCSSPWIFAAYHVLLRL